MQVRFLPGLHRREARRASGGFFCGQQLGLLAGIQCLPGFLKLGFKLPNLGAELGCLVFVARRFVGLGLELAAVALLRPEIVDRVKGHSAHRKQANFVLPGIEGRYREAQHKKEKEHGSDAQQEAFKQGAVHNIH